MSRATPDYSAWNEANAQANAIDARIFFEQAIKRVTDNPHLHIPHDPTHMRWLAMNCFELAMHQINILFHRRPLAFDLNKTPRCL